MDTKDRMYFYEKQNGDIVIESAESAWRVHDQYMKKYWKYLGWSDGRFIKALRNTPNPKDSRGLPAQPDAERRAALQEATQNEINFARSNPDRVPPEKRNIQQFNGGAYGAIGKSQDPTITNAIRMMQ